MNGAQTQSIPTKDQARIAEIRYILTIVIHMMATPLVLIFWLSDLLYVPDLAYKFLALRLSIIPVSLITLYLMKNYVHSLTAILRIAAFYGTLVALPINIMIMIIPNVTTVYFCGLMLVTIGASFVPYNRKYFIYVILGIHLPYLATCIYRIRTTQDLSMIMVNSFFILSTICMAFMIRYFHARLNKKAYTSNAQLHQEIINREAILKQKIDETIRLKMLNYEIGPNSIKTIQYGLVPSQSSTANTVCAVFIKMSDRYCTLLNDEDRDLKSKVQLRFLNTALETIFKNDIHIEQIHTDGILAFKCSPTPYDEQISRVCKVALDFKKEIQHDLAFFQNLGVEPLEFQIGISTGSAEVNLFGKPTKIRTYSAMGLPLTTAAKLANAAAPNQILFDSKLEEGLRSFNYVYNAILPLKNHEQGIEHSTQFELIGRGSFEKVDTLISRSCQNCDSNNIYMDTNSQGQFLVRCRECGNFNEGRISDHLSVEV